MDRTLKRAKRRNKKRIERNTGAWERFCPNGVHCRFCGHDGSKHLLSSGQPHFYRPATERERRDPYLMLYRHNPPEGGSVLVRADDRRRPRRAHHGLLHGLRREHRDPPSPVLPAEPGNRRGHWTQDRKGNQARRLKRHEKGETT